MATTTLQPTDADNRAYSGAANTNYGTENRIIAGTQAHSFFKFNGLGNGTIPSTNTIISAVLGLYATAKTASSDRDYVIHRLKRAWVETESTWNSWKSGSAWSTAGGTGNDDMESSYIGLLTIAAAAAINEFKYWTLTAQAIKDMNDGTWINNGFLIKTTVETNSYTDFASREYATPSNRPKMTIEHVAGNKTVWFYSAIRQWVWERWGEMGLEWLRRQAYPVHYTLDRRTGLWVNPLTEARYMKPDAILYRTILRAGANT